MRRVEPERPFLVSEKRSWTYGESLAEMESRKAASPRLSQPSLSPAHVFDIVAGLMSGGVTIVGPEPETTTAADADMVVFTSGSAGPPKGVRLTMANLEAAARASAEHLGHGGDDNWLLAMPLHHVGGLSIVVRQIYTGGSITMLPSFDAAAYAEALHGDVTMASVVPTMLRRLLPYGPYTGLRSVLVGGGPIPRGLLEEAVATGLPVLPTYGMTETFGQVATLLPGSALGHRAHPLPGIDVRITDDGRIAVRGPQVSPGYVGEPDREDPWFVTSDLGTLDDDGAVRVTGRADALIVTGGENVNPERVEAALIDHPAVEEAVVAGIPDAEWGSRLVCVYAGDVDSSALQHWASERLPGYAVPKQWIMVSSVPRTGIGKPDRRAAADLAVRGYR